MRISRLGHAALLVEAAGRRVLIDPGAFSEDEAFTQGDLDAIIVTHQHADHVDQSRIGALVEANRQATLLAPRDTAEMLGGDWASHGEGDVTACGELTITGVGELHAVIHSELPRVHNVGVTITAPGEPVLYHPGDAYDRTPPEVDILAVPLSAPWTKVSETIDFVRGVAPGTLFPIHDRTISELAYDIYWGHLVRFARVEDARRLSQVEALEI